MKGFLAACVLVLAVTPAAADDGVGLGLGVMAGTCSTDSEIAPAERSAIESAGLTLAQTLVGDHPEAAFDQMSQAVQTSTSREGFATAVVKAMAVGAPYDAPRVAHAYLVTSIGAGTANAPVGRGVCGPMSDDNWVNVAVKPGEDTGYVLVGIDGRNNGWTLAVTLKREGAAWRAQYLHFDTSSVVGLDSARLLDMGRREREAGHMFNAYMLVTGAAYAAQRGPDVELGIMQPVHAEFDKIAVPAELKGTAPFHWVLNGKTFDLTIATIIGIDKKLGVQFDLPQKDWPGNDGADARNREFIDAFRAANPDYASVFTFILARAIKPDNSGGFASAYDNKDGYLHTPATPAAPHP